MQPEGSNPDNSAVIVFAKAPEKGVVKTRLAKTVGDASALALYQCFVADVLTMLKSTDRVLRIYFHPVDAGEQVRAWLGNGLDLFPQCGHDLGEKMKIALTETFAAGFSRAIVIGTDLPDLPPDIIQEAFDLLKDNPAVIGPSLDGGYYLIGFTADDFVPDVFDDISWGTAAVLNHTLNRFRNHRVIPRLLPVWRDIDTTADLETLTLNLQNAPGTAVHTANYLQQHNKIRRTI